MTTTEDDYDPGGAKHFNLPENGKDEEKPESAADVKSPINLPESSADMKRPINLPESSADMKRPINLPESSADMKRPINLPESSADDDTNQRRKSICRRLINLLSLTKEGASPVNWKVVILVVVALFSSCYSITFLFPFVPDMILHFGYKEEQKGYFAGLIASSMFAGRIFGSYFWGWLSDVKGRKPVILICLLCIMLTNVGFGFSVNIPMAVAFRFLNGLFNGIVGTAKTVLYEISDNTNQAVGISTISLAWGSGIVLGPLISGVVGASKAVLYEISDNTNQAVGMSTIAFAFGIGIILGPLISAGIGVSKAVLYEISDNTNQAIGISTISLAWGSGIVLGPLISGYLSQPALRYPVLFAKTGIFGKFPFLLPSLLAALMCIISFVLIWFLLPETLEAKKKKKESIVLEIHEEEYQQDKSTSQIEVEMKELHDKPVINRQLSRVKETEVVCNKGSAQSLHNQHNTSRSSSVKSLQCTGAGSKARSRLAQPYVGGCIVTSQGDLLLPDLYTSRSHSNLYKRQRSTGSESGHLKKRTARLSLSHNDLRTENSKSRPDSVKETESLSLLNIENGSGEAVNRIQPERILPESVITAESNKGNQSCCKCWRVIMNTKFMKLMAYSDVRMAILIYTLMSFGTIGLDDVFTIWASTAVIYSGLGFTSDQIGSAIGFSSIPLVFLQVFIFPKLEAKFGAKKIMTAFMLILIVNCMLIPSLRVLLDKSVIFWTLLMIVMGLNKIAQVTCFSANGLHINNSVPSQFAGSANGIAMTFTAIGRTIAPVMGGSVFAWSIVYGVKIGFPFDVNCIFIIFSFGYLICNIMAARLPKRLDKQSKKHDTTLQEDNDDDG